MSRFFAPQCGINEDPVCGSAHCCLTPYWSAALGKTELLAYQASARGGVLRVRLADARVELAGLRDDHHECPRPADRLTLDTHHSGILSISFREILMVCSKSTGIVLPPAITVKSPERSAWNPSSGYGRLPDRIERCRTHCRFRTFQSPWSLPYRYRGRRTNQYRP